ncbi:3'-5' exonuclease [Shewanella amazonensis]|uniref:DNA polymerase III epsilon subunit-related 3'-5' exonuclease-like protein n=1 Tax=Shewanella amazonensis (strain ATCC BAA-1098 / SB2B) TaxID=326297 RepID=A1S5S6_SHEAM|nr:3'-5' exonuclease [Shewanella amazonensis]ABL99732.1 DNA polymerase III epsilon subunit-related 3'-5' exonuclease-like protein [Shewanella amazonensis SB2B]
MVSRAFLRPRLWWRSRTLDDGLARTLVDSQRALLSAMAESAPMLALDLEMTGLDPGRDQILAIGVVPIDGGIIQLQGAESVLVEIQGSVGQSAVIHGITDRELHNALPLADAMNWLMQKMNGRILVAHHAPLDLAFIRANMSRSLGISMPMLAIDTLALERQRLLRIHDAIQEGSLRLGASRQRYGLPVYDAHNALTDALSCAELLLAQLAAIGGAHTRVAELVTLCD